jgi:hypothetical protein
VRLRCQGVRCHSCHCGRGKGKGVGGWSSGTIIKSSPDSSESDSPEGRLSGFDEPYTVPRFLVKIREIARSVFEIIPFMGLMQASPWTVNPSFHFWQQRVSHVVAQLPSRNSIWRRHKVCLAQIGQPGSPLSGFTASLSQTGGIRKQAGLFRAPKPRRQEPCVFPQCLGWCVSCA